jgi:hypothetical protein
MRPRVLDISHPAAGSLRGTPDSVAPVTLLLGAR